MDSYPNTPNLICSRDILYIRYVDDYTFFSLIGDVKNKSILDIGCGSGEHTRIFKSMGASHVAGMDCMLEMVEFARKQEELYPLGIQYLHKNMFIPEIVGNFDLVVAFSVLSQAPTREYLLKTCQMAAHNLKSGGRFIAVGMNPAQPPETYPLCEKYGFKPSLSGTLTEGATITTTLCIDGHDVVDHDYYLSHACYEWALRTAGFHVINWHSPVVSPEGIQKSGLEFWQDFIQHKMSIYLACVK